MAFERFTREARAVVTEAERQAAAEGADAIEPVHVLMALAADPATPGGRALGAVGLDPEAISAAAREDDRAILAAVGVEVGAHAGAGARGSGRRVRFAPASKRLLERSLRLAMQRGDRHIDSGHVLRATLAADAARIPQVLRTAGTSVGDVERALGG